MERRLAVSYRITIDGEPFCASNLEHTALLDPRVSLEANKSGTLTFVMMPDHPYYDSIVFRQSVFDVYLNDELIFEGIPVSETTDFFNRKTVTCEGELTFLNDTVQEQAVYRGQTARNLLAAYIAKHNSQCDSNKTFSLGSVTVDGGDSIFRYTNFQSTMQEIQEDLVDNFGGFLRVRHSGSARYLDYLAESPRTSSQVIRIGLNLVDLSRNLSSLNICTILIPLGARIEDEVDVEGLDKRVTIESVNGGKNYLIGEGQAFYGNIWATQTWDGVSNPSILKSKAQEWLQDQQWANLVIEASAIDLGLTSEDVEQFRVLDMIRVVSEPHGIDRLFMLTKLDIDLDHPGSTQVTLGQEESLPLTARAAKTQTEVETMESRVMINASKNAKQILESSTSGNIYFRYGSDGRVYEVDIMDTADPETAQKIWRWNLGGWGYSGDGGETYTVAATMDGAIVASMITTGILKSDDGTTFYLDLDNGILKGNFSELKIEGSAAASQSYATSEASTAVSNYDTSLNQQVVFNKLTNNKTNQGIYLSNGNLYINASMINSGYISAARIEANSIAVSKLTGSISNGNWNIDLDAGTFTIGNISAANITTGTLSADRIGANTIAVGKLTGSITGGLSNSWVINLTDGTMTVGNISAANITTGTLAAARIAANSIAVGKLTGSISNGNWKIDLDEGTFTIGNISAANITTGTLAAARIGANTIAVSKLTGSIANGDWKIDLDAGTLTLGSLAVSKITGSKSLGNNWSIDFDNGTMTIGSVAANKITAGTISAAVTASNLTMTGGSINMTTTSQTYDVITLDHTLSKTTITSNGLYIANKSGAENPNIRIAINGAAINISNTSTTKPLSYFGGADLRFYDASGNQLSYFSKSGLGFNNSSGKTSSFITTTSGGGGVLSLNDSTGEPRIQINDGGLYYYNSSGSLIARIMPVVVSTW